MNHKNAFNTVIGDFTLFPLIKTMQKTFLVLGKERGMKERLDEKRGRKKQQWREREDKGIKMEDERRGKLICLLIRHNNMLINTNLSADLNISNP